MGQKRSPMGTESMNPFIKNSGVSCAIWFAALSMSSCDNSLLGDPTSNPPGKISSDGINLIGGYRFATVGGGDLSALYGADGFEVVPPGAAMTVIKEAYCIGFFGRGGAYFDNGKRVSVERVFFVIFPNGKIDFHLPNPTDIRFLGAKILTEIHFN